MEMDRIASNDRAAAEAAVPATLQKGSRKRTITIFVVVSCINVALLALLWTLLLTPHTGAPQGNNSGLGDMSSPVIGQPAPDFTLSAVDGSASPIHLAALKGKPVIVNFWLASCQPCNAEAPFLQQSWQQLRARGVVLIGVDGPEKSSDAQAFLQKYAVTYPNVKDTIDGATAINFGATGQPETFFIDRQGVVRARWVGELTADGLQAELAKIQVQ